MTPDSASPRLGGSVENFDWILVGGGLQNGLIALTLLDVHPNARIAVIEPERLGGNHTWCFQRTDVEGELEPWLNALVERTWPEQQVSFPGNERTLAAEYCFVPSVRLANALEAALQRAPHAVRFKARAESVMPGRVALDDGRALHGTTVVDARGPSAGTTPNERVAYQKFLGLELELERPIDTTRVHLMDARVEQLDGFRFFYVLPLTPTRVLIEDTYYSDTPALDCEALRDRVLEYAETQGFAVARMLREERGVLPIPLSTRGLCDSHQGETPGLLRAGYAGGFFHPTTGYSFPIALRLARLLAGAAAERSWGPELEGLRSYVARQQRFCVQLNRLLFFGYAPDQRWRVLARFYRLPAELIARFYGLSSTRSDALRILLGRPPRGFSAPRYLRAWLRFRADAPQLASAASRRETQNISTSPRVPQEGIV